MPPYIQLSDLLYMLSKTVNFSVIKMSHFSLFFLLYVQFTEHVGVNPRHNPNIWYGRMTHLTSYSFYMNFIWMDSIIRMIDVSL